MRRLLTFILCFFTAYSFAQQPLTKSRTSSVYTYIYQLPDEQLLKLYQDDDKEIEKPMFGKLVDSALTDKIWQNNLPPGNYVRVRANRDRLVTNLIENKNTIMQVVSYQNTIEFILTDKAGNRITNASVSNNNKPLAYNIATGMYAIKASSKNIIVVKYNGISSFYSFKPINDNADFFLVRWAKSSWRWVKNIIGSGDKRNYYDRDKPWLKDHSGFIVFNKPKYKPRDTVRFKAFIVDKKTQKPISNKTLLVRIADKYSDDEFKTIGTVNSYRPGMYEYSFVLTDSLDLDLDDTYKVLLTDTKKMQKEVNEDGEDEDDDDDDEKDLDENEKNYLQYMAGTFDFEEYELKSIKFSMRTDKEEHSRGDSLHVYFKAVDENELPVPDGRIDLTVTTNYINAYYGNKIFIRDTLWRHKLPMEALGETKLAIPDSIFPAADINYSITAQFLNSSNESRGQSKYMRYKHAAHVIKADLNADTLKATGYYLGRKQSLKAKIYGISGLRDTIYNQSTTLPATVKINPYVERYLVETDSASTEVFMGSKEPGISVTGQRTQDSVQLVVDNPHKLHFWYSIYLGKDLLTRGEADSLVYKRALSKPEDITCFLYYLWAGRLRTLRQTFGYQAEVLDINIDAPITVYPGQKVTTNITVTDSKKRPVPNVDLTAWGVTSKFENYNAPLIPVFGKAYPIPRLYNKYRLAPLDADISRVINWQQWARKLGLDTIEYYKFTHPQGKYILSETGPDTLTQIAPFVVKNGAILPAHIVYVNSRPVYFSQAEQLKPYSFKVDSGKYDITFRMDTAQFTVKNIYVPLHKKTVVSIDAAEAVQGKNPDITWFKETDTLSRFDADILNKYFVNIANTFDKQLAYLQQGEQYYVLSPELSSRNATEVLAGPLTENHAKFVVKDSLPLSFITEPSYTYTFLPGLLKQKSIPGRYPFNTRLSRAVQPTAYTDYALTRKAIDTLWQNCLDQRSASEPLFVNKISYNNVRLLITLPTVEKQNDLVKNIIFYRYNDPDYIKIYEGSHRKFAPIDTGLFRVFFLLKGDRYFVQDSIQVKRYGQNYYEIALKAKARDSVSIKINEVIQRRTRASNAKDDDIVNDELALKETFNEQYFEYNNFTEIITGEVTDKTDKIPLPGVTILVKGTKVGVLTDKYGRFKLKVPDKGKIWVGFIGYKTQELVINPGEHYKIELNEDTRALNEVVVVGYGSRSRQEMVGALASVRSEVSAEQLLQGKVSGVSIADAPGFKGNIQVRGLNSNTGNGPVLYVIDGKTSSQNAFKSLSRDDIDNLSVLNGTAATALYGAEGANGAIVITTRKQRLANEAEAAQNAPEGGQQTLRKNFSDYAYWQPRLTTDAEGKASFTTTFPDDITSWRTFVIASASGKANLKAVESRIKSFKPIAASLITPQFAVEGDKLSVIGKVMNYEAEPARVYRKFLYNRTALKYDSLRVQNSKIDTLQLTASAADSLTFEYTLQRANGYSDGEQRKIPVIKQGVQETKGIFDALRGDTTLTLKFDSALGKVTFRAEASALPALLEETDRLRAYKYLCNEQLASKLKALLTEKRIKQYLNQPFDHEPNVTDIIKKMNENRNGSGLWGWWKGNDDEIWISRHAVEALLDAKKAGYRVTLDTAKIAKYLLYQLDSYKGYDKLGAMELMLKLGAKADYKTYIAEAEKVRFVNKDSSLYNALRLLLIKQKNGQKVDVLPLLKQKKSTMYGNIYWGEPSYRFFDNSVQLSVLAYQVLKADGGHTDLLQRITGYLLEQRQAGCWRNTYESSLILETILPELMNGQQALKAPQLKLSGAKTETVEKFPYTTSFDTGQLSIAKTGTMPVYISAYQQFLNPQPQKMSKDFTVDTWFKDDTKSRISKLKGGKKITLTAQVNARADGEFVMIEIPIPAGCSYDTKEQSWRNNEIHREYFKEKVSIFCRKLKKGTYTFNVQLMPRYDGEYTLNPAKAELMYFPVFYGREGIKKVSIGGN